MRPGAGLERIPTSTHTTMAKPQIRFAPIAPRLAAMSPDDVARLEDRLRLRRRLRRGPSGAIAYSARANAIEGRTR